MYNLQTAKEEIEQVAKHTSALTEYVVSLSERALAHDGLDAKLNEFKGVLMKELDAKFAELEHKIFGNAISEDGASSVAELGHKMAALLRTPGPSHAPNDHHTDGQSHEHHG